MQDINSLTIFIINGKTKFIHEGSSHGLDLFEQRLNIVRITIVVTLQYQGWIKIKKMTLENSNHVFNHSDGSLSQLLLYCNPALFGGIKLLL